MMHCLYEYLNLNLQNKVPVLCAAGPELQRAPVYLFPVET